MSTEDNSELDLRLMKTVATLQAVPEAASEAAQFKLMQRLQQDQLRSNAAPRPSKLPQRRWLSAAAMVLSLIAVVWLTPMFSAKGHAFAQVQAHFLRFSSLVMHISTRINSVPTQQTTVQINAQGQVRTDVGQLLSTIVDPSSKQVMILLHPQKIAVIEPITNTPDGPNNPGTDWLEQLRAFKGKAIRLKKSKTIDGIAAQAWALQLNGQDTRLWVDPQGMPLAMEINSPGLIRTDLRFKFNQALAPALFSAVPPAGYRLEEADED
jgi:outer membrane lipoprotein-sorting protein